MIDRKENCSNCRLLLKDINDKPCSVCKAITVMSEWQPDDCLKENCSNCHLLLKDINDKPCSVCKAIIVMTKWQPDERLYDKDRYIIALDVLKEYTAIENEHFKNTGSFEVWLNHLINKAISDKKKG